jgi:hypothetical protein
MTDTIPSVSQTIYDQLGNRRFTLMTGAKEFTVGDNWLAFRLPGKGGFVRKSINYVKVTLDRGSDTYILEFKRIWGGKVTDIAKYDRVHCDELTWLFERETGLATRLF